jgi:hypothetical protein
MLNLFKLKLFLPILLIMLSLQAFCQYTYTRYSLDITGGASFPRTSIAGSVSGYTELGFKGTLSRFLSLRASGGTGVVHGSQEVSHMTGAPESVSNYTKFNTTYYYITGSAHLNLERLLRLRSHGRKFHRLNPFLVIGSGYMFPDIKVNRFDGRVQNYKKDVRFVTHNFGLDFKYFLSNRFDLSIGGEYRIVQTYYLDGVYTDKKLDGLINAYVGLSYNIGASADRKHMEWFNLDGQVDVLFVPEERKVKEPEIPIAKEDEPIIDSSVFAKEPNNITEEPEDTFNYNAIENDTTAENVLLEPEKKSESVDSVTNEPAIAQTDGTKKVGRHSDIKPGKPKPVKDSATIAKVTEPEKPVQPEPVVSTEHTSLNDVDGIIRPLGKYNVIVGTYAGSKYAYLFRDKLRKQGFEAALFRSSSRSKMIRVCVYYGDDRAEAIRQLRSYQKKFNGQAWIHVYDPK